MELVKLIIKCSGKGNRNKYCLVGGHSLSQLISQLIVSVG